MGGASSSYNYEIPNSKEQGFTPIYRKRGAQQLMTSPQEGVNTIVDLLRVCNQRYGHKESLGEVVVTTQKDGQGQDVEVRTIRNRTYAQAYEESEFLGLALHHQKLYYVEDEQGMRLIGIYAKNRAEWFVTDWACVGMGYTSIPLYDTLGVENMSYCLNQTGITTLFVTSTTIDTLATLQDFGNLRNVISYDPLTPEQIKKAESLKLNVLFYDKLVEEGRNLPKVEEADTKPDDIYTFSYTSGTTGPPKGVMLSHKNMLSCMATFNTHEDAQINSSDTYMSYLPLPHVMERTISLYTIYKGAHVVVSSGNTLKLKDDCQTVRPSVFVSVPRIFNRIVDAIKTKFANQTGVKKWLIDRAVNAKMYYAKEQGLYKHSIYDPIIFSKVRESFGGRIRIMASGSAPMNPEAIAFLKTIMCCPLIEGYGQTENAAGALLARAYDNDYGSLVEVGAGIEVKLADLPEMRYTSEDRDEQGRLAPRGELWFRGPQIFRGYYKLKEKTDETITKDGWMQTGDIAQLNPEKISFRIIDRKKNIFKLQQGEYVAPDKVENVYQKSPLVAELFLHGDSSQHFAVAVVSPRKDALLRLAQEHHIAGNFEELCGKKQVRELVLGDLNRVGKEEGLHGFELAQNVWLEPLPFLEKNILTNTQKLMRFEARQVYKSEIAQLYKEGEILKK